MSTPKPHQKLGELLVANGALQPEQLQAALGHQRRWGGRLGEILVGMGFIQEGGISKALSRQLGIPEINLSSLAVPENVLSRLPVEFCKRNQVMPFALRRDERGVSFLHVAMADPSDLGIVDEIRFQTGLDVEVALASEMEISLAIHRHFKEVLETSSPFADSFIHHSTGELLRFGEEPLQMDEEAEAEGKSENPEQKASGVEVTLTQQQNSVVSKEGREEDLYDVSSPALRAVEALVRILARKGILLESEYLEEVLGESPPPGAKKPAEGGE